MATIALFIALGGVSYAAVNLPANSVGTKQLKNGAVTNKKLSKAAVADRQIKNNSITGSKIKLSTLGTVPAAKHADSATHAESAAAADSAMKVNGVMLTHFSATDPAGTADHTIATIGPLTIQAGCTSASVADLRASMTEENNNMVDTFGQAVMGSADVMPGTLVSLTNNQVPYGGMGTAVFVGYTSHKDYKIDWFVRGSTFNAPGCFYSGYVQNP